MRSWSKFSPETLVKLLGLQLRQGLGSGEIYFQMHSCGCRQDSVVRSLSQFLAMWGTWKENSQHGTWLPSEWVSKRQWVPKTEGRQSDCNLTLEELFYHFSIIYLLGKDSRRGVLEAMLTGRRLQKGMNTRRWSHWRPSSNLPIINMNVKYKAHFLIAYELQEKL